MDRRIGSQQAKRTDPADPAIAPTLRKGLTNRHGKVSRLYVRVAQMNDRDSLRSRSRLVTSEPKLVEVTIGGYELWRALCHKRLRQEEQAPYEDTFDPYQPTLPHH